MVCHIPYRYVRRLILGGMTPRAVWRAVYPAIVADNAEVQCAPLLAYLRIACVRRAAASGGNPAPPPITTAAPVPVIPDDTLVRAANGGPPSRPPRPIRPSSAAAARTKTPSVKPLRPSTPARSRRSPTLRQTAVAAKTKTPEEKWGAAIATAYRIHSCYDDTGLPPDLLCHRGVT